MPYKPLFLIVVLCLLAACSDNLYPGYIGRTLGPEKQQFTIKAGRDTILRLKGGMVLHFCPNTFVGAGNKFTLEVLEVRDRGDAYLSGISTLATDGRLLETEGMLYLRVITSDGSVVSINKDCPIRLEIPVKGRRPGMKWFRGTLVAQDVRWTEIPGGLNDQTGLDALATGQQLFKKLCVSCHCPDLSSPRTGPALGNITRFRNDAWLRAFTRNSQALIASGDTAAVCCWNKWKPTMMSSFDQLSDAEIDAIYQFISEESARLDVRVDSTNYTCVPGAEHVSAEPGDTSILEDSSSGYSSRPPNPYFAKIYEMGWHNCDRFIDDTSARDVVIRLSVAEPGQYDELLSGIMFDELNANIQLSNYRYDGGQLTSEVSARLPAAPARLVVIGIKDKNWFLYEQAFRVNPANDFTAILQPVSAKKIKAFIRTKQFRKPQQEAVKQACLQAE